MCIRDRNQLDPNLAASQTKSMATRDRPTTAMPQLQQASLDYVPGSISEHLSDLHQMLGSQMGESGIVAESPAMHALLQQAEKFAQSSATVLLTGESGTGKEVVAQWIHERSQRRLRPYVRVNCAALPESLVESELFGHARGAFTGAVTSRDGRFTTAGDGSILLDEISEISLPMQAKLLRVLEEGEYQPLGSGQVQVCLLYTSPSPRDS